MSRTRERIHFLTPFLVPTLFFTMSCFTAAAPAPTMQPPEEKLAATLKEKTERLGREIESLRGSTPGWKLVDVEVAHKAAVWVAAHGEWYKDYAKYTDAVLDRGLARADQLKAGRSPWLDRQGTILRGYYSAVDLSVQPYQVVLPKSYPGEGKKWRLDLILHGRDDTMSEVKFMRAGDSAGPAPDQDYVELHVYGRGNNAYRWAGERDVFEALESFRAAEESLRGREMIDSDRIVLRGFSMGGAGAWHLGLHYPGFWCSVSPGAGFTTTYGRVKNPDGKLPDYVVKCLGIYDALDYAENVFDVPVVAYGGEIDPQREASESIKDKITPMGLHATFLVGPKMGHKYDPESLKKIMQLQGEQAAAGLKRFPEHVRFVTMTPTYSDCLWVRVLRQERQYERSLVDAERKEDGFHVKTENVRTLQLTVPDNWRDRKTVVVNIDGASVTASKESSPATGERSSLLLEKVNGKWTPTDEDLASSKRPGMAGPIDDAFMLPFLCIRGTGKPWNPAVQRRADATLQQFQREWDKYFRGKLRVADDATVSREDLKGMNLILFGDPGSNRLIRELLPSLPLKWTEHELVMNDKTYPAAENMPAMVYPSPLIKTRYVVLNSGHTFHEADFKSSNRMLYPRLGDWAVISAGDTDQVVAAGLFNEEWKWDAGPGR